jgi:uroporphyrin-III C-methyltransferase
MTNSTEITKSSVGIGTVYLVGAGPGSVDLLTLRAARLIENASVIVHDGLVKPEVLALAPSTVRLISVAKQRARHSVPQPQIEEILITEARKGHNVIRLKGGDPFVFGRGGEEVDACRAAGVPVEIVPGISAALACASQVRLPLTHRDAASAVTFVAGQCKGLSEQNWAGLAVKGRTLVIYMGIANAGAIADKLIADGLSPDFPAIVIENGGRENFRALRTILTDLGDMTVRKQVKSPALIVVGDVVRYADAQDELRTIFHQAEVVFETEVGA